MLGCEVAASYMDLGNYMNAYDSPGMTGEALPLCVLLTSGMTSSSSNLVKNST